MNTDEHSAESLPDQKLRKPVRNKIRVRIFIFLVCLAISGSMWVFIELMKDYTTDLPFTITFKNVPKDLILETQTDSTIVAGVTAQGFELLVAEFLRKQQSLEIDLSDLRIRQGEDGYTAFIPASQIIQQVAAQLNYSRAISYIKPDTLFFRFSEVYRKRVPVLPDVSLSFADQYQLYDSVRINPQTVLVSSIKNVIDTIRFVTTQHIELNNLDSNRVVSASLRKSLRANMIRYSPDSVTISVGVRRYTEAVFNVPITVTGSILPVRLFPDQVEVTCQVPFSDYREIDVNAFTAEVQASPSMLSANKRLPVVLTKFPVKVRSIRLKPEQVEYIIIAK